MRCMICNYEWCWNCGLSKGKYHTMIEPFCIIQTAVRNSCLGKNACIYIVLEILAFFLFPVLYCGICIILVGILLEEFNRMNRSCFKRFYRDKPLLCCPLAFCLVVLAFVIANVLVLATMLILVVLFYVPAHIAYILMCVMKLYTWAPECIFLCKKRNFSDRNYEVNEEAEMAEPKVEMAPETAKP